MVGMDSAGRMTCFHFLDSSGFVTFADIDEVAG